MNKTVLDTFGKQVLILDKEVNNLQEKDVTLRCPLLAALFSFPAHPVSPASFHTHAGTFLSRAKRPARNTKLPVAAAGISQAV